ncbi:hypothetical protein [Cellulomonas sp. SLBN-39]|uniref:hypothetical protein n=1 Tax=Cellulomonas sp. SLBN-39 TaxID=2768446 RepID=UPI00114F8E2E|nr:hypothetical protein [Cellulomonas sp. SLBN-39]TQL01846.1 hypothetical protein FBY24_0906 [Cellulomonas sp. SLBN-39]
MTSESLYERARALEVLADDVEGVLDTTRSVVTTPDWECDNATDVREAVTHWRAAAQTAARNLRAQAGDVRGEARRAADREQAERDARHQPQAW